MTHASTTLIATLGASWQVIPEIAAALAPERCSLYAQHPNQAALQNIRQRCGVDKAPVEQLWIITSESKVTQEGLHKIQQWNQRLAQPFQLAYYVAQQTTHVTTESELGCLRELVFRVMLHATAQSTAVVCSLAGGRKTMSADLQRAASLFGCNGMLHIVAPEPLPDFLRNQKDPIDFIQPFPAQEIAQLLPAFIGEYSRNAILDLELLDSPSINGEQYPLNHAFYTDEQSLVSNVEQRERNAQQLMSNYLNQLATQEKHENWRHLYRLSPRQIAWLKETRVDASHYALLQSLPKAELHCHLGGLPDLAQQIQIGQAIWQTLSTEQQTQLKLQLNTLLTTQHWPDTWTQLLEKSRYNGQQRAERAATLLTQCSQQTLEYNLWQTTQPRIGLQNAQGFSAYERPGELCGSAVLSHPSAIKPYIESIIDYAQRDHIQYLELRGSPHKYSDDPIGWLQNFYQQWQLLKTDALDLRFIWIVDRRGENAADVVQYAVQAQQCLPDFVVGLDLAGDERATTNDFAAHFLPAFEHCLPITIHAGEGEPAANIWNAAYHLHADRIGHGLTLEHAEELLQRFRNRNICLELCPTSNKEVIGFSDPDDAHSVGYPQYPLKKLWDAGVAICINTDNPAISCTTLTAEYICASRMVGGLSLWDTLAIHKQSFSHAMCSFDHREALLKRIDKDIFKRITDYLKEAI